MTDWATESPYNPGLGANDTASWIAGMSRAGAGGGFNRFNWNGVCAWRTDFIEATDDPWADNVDILLYIGHGNPTCITFTGTPNLFYNEPRGLGETLTKNGCVSFRAVCCNGCGIT